MTHEHDAPCDDLRNARERLAVAETELATHKQLAD